MSLNASMSSPVRHLVDLVSLGLCLLVVRGIAEVVAVKSPATVPAGARDGGAGAQRERAGVLTTSAAG
jgi:hypothetical protein